MLQEQNNKTEVLISCFSFRSLRRVITAQLTSVALHNIQCYLNAVIGEDYNLLEVLEVELGILKEVQNVIDQPVPVLLLHVI